MCFGGVSSGVSFGRQGVHLRVYGRRNAMLLFQVGRGLPRASDLIVNDSARPASCSGPNDHQFYGPRFPADLWYKVKSAGLDMAQFLYKNQNACGLCVLSLPPRPPQWYGPHLGIISITPQNHELSIKPLSTLFKPSPQDPEHGTAGPRGGFVSPQYKLHETLINPRTPEKTLEPLINQL